MTTPNERFRAIRWARELLHLVVADVEAPEDIRRQAAELLADYPADIQLREVIRNGTRYLPHGIAAGLEVAAKLVHQPWPASATTLKHQRHVRRHFPTAFEVRHESIEQDEHLARALGGVPQWIWPDDEE